MPIVTDFYVSWESIFTDNIGYISFQAPYVITGKNLLSFLSVWERNDEEHPTNQNVGVWNLNRSTLMLHLRFFFISWDWTIRLQMLEKAA